MRTKDAQSRFTAKAFRSVVIDWRIQSLDRNQELHAYIQPNASAVTAR
jgi:hypothetical protein